MFNMFVVALVPFKSHCYFKNLFRSRHLYTKTGSRLTWPNFTKRWYHVLYCGLLTFCQGTIIFQVVEHICPLASDRLICLMTEAHVCD